MAAATLSAYRNRRDFSSTPEPAGTAPPGGGSRFVVHKHHATADHYDLRLELVGVLPSRSSEYAQAELAWVLYQWQGNTPGGGRC